MPKPKATQPQQLCRVCMEPANLKSIFDTLNMQEIMEHCSNIKLRADDGLPNQICIGCEERFRDAFSLRNLAETNDKYLRKMLATKNKDSVTDVTIKLENPETVEVAVKVENQSDGFLSSDDDTALVSFVQVESVVDVAVKGFDPESSDHSHESLIDEPPPKKKKYVRPKKKAQEKKPKPDKSTDLPRCRLPKSSVICFICGKSTIRLSEHLKLHTTEEKFQCDICSKHLKTRATLTTHIKLVHQKKRIPCNGCDMLFWNKTGLRLHQNKVHFDSSELFQCNLCKASFAHSDTLTSHLKYHEYMQRKTGGKQQYFKSSLNCSACDHVYFTDHQYKAHHEAHAGKYECKICGEVFKQSSTVAVHKKYVHKAVLRKIPKTYFCDLCEYTTTHDFNLKRHQKIMHQKVKS